MIRFILPSISVQNERLVPRQKAPVPEAFPDLLSESTRDPKRIKILTDVFP